MDYMHVKLLCCVFSNPRKASACPWQKTKYEAWDTIVFKGPVHPTLLTYCLEQTSTTKGTSNKYEA